MTGKEKDNIDSEIDSLASKLAPIVERMKEIYNLAVEEYTQLVEDICNRRATEDEVEWLLTWMLDFADDGRMLMLYKRVCRAYLMIYPEAILYYIMEYRKLYDPNSLIGTKYEYLFHENGIENNLD